MITASVALATAFMFRLRIWRQAPDSRMLTMALLYLCAASILAPPVLGRWLDGLSNGDPANLADLISNCLVVFSAWTLVTMVSQGFYGPNSDPWWQNLLALSALVAMIATYIKSPRLHIPTGDGLLAATGAGAKLYIGIYSATVIAAALRVLYLSRRLDRLNHAARGGMHGEATALTAAAAFSALYGVSVAAFLGRRHFGATARLPLVHATLIGASWWLATIALVILAVAGVAGVRRTL